MNDDNLKGYGFHERTASEQREIAIAGGKASGESRRKTANFRQTLNKLLTTPIDSPEWTPLLEAMGLDSTLESALNMRMIKAGLDGNVKAYEAIAKYAGQSTQTEAGEEEQRIRMDRARRARDQEVGGEDQKDESIQNFLKATRLSEDVLKDLYNEEADNAEKGEEAGGV